MVEFVWHYSIARTRKCPDRRADLGDISCTSRAILCQISLPFRCRWQQRHPGVNLNDAVKLADTENHTNRTKNYDSILLSSIILYHRYNSAALPKQPVIFVTVGQPISVFIVAKIFHGASNTGEVWTFRNFRPLNLCTSETTQTQWCYSNLTYLLTYLDLLTLSRTTHCTQTWRCNWRKCHSSRSSAGIGCNIGGVFTARCTLVQSAVLRSHVVCLSVRPSVRLSVCDVGGLWSHRLEFFRNNFTVS